jgi:hypothetical protein
MTDRRHTSRFPVHEDVTYLVVSPGAVRKSGKGKTLNFGSGGLLLTTEERLPSGYSVEILVTWHSAIDGKFPLEFVASGLVVWSDGDRAAVKFDRYEFRVRSKAAAAIARPRRVPPVKVKRAGAAATA